jgi:putative peptide zinc metalloprotease protein
VPPETATKEQATQAEQNGPPRLADGIELIGVYEGSGFKDPPHIVRRADGQVVQLPELLFVVAEECADGASSCDELAVRVADRMKVQLTGEDVRFLCDEKLRPLGVMAAENGASQELKKIDPLLALKFRARVVPERAVRAVTTVFHPLFFPPVIVAVIGGLIAIDVWMFGFHGVAQSVRSVLYDPAFILLLLGLVILSAAFHECGHATACRYGGATPGVMGAGLYIVWPAFYTDVTDAYRLGKAGRLRTDLGGIYFNAIFTLGTAAVYFLTGFEPLLLVMILQQIEIVHQLLPFLRMDGYYILSDLTGVPDMFARIKPTLRSLIPGREKDPRVDELKPWVRTAVTIYVFTLIPTLLFMFSMMLFNAPRIFATAWDSLFLQWDKASAAFGDGSILSGVVDSLQILILLLPAAGIVASFGRAGIRAGQGGWKVTRGHPIFRSGLTLVAAGVAALLAFIWWPNGDYKPIQPGERGTIGGALAEFKSVGTGRPALTKQREQQLGGAPTKRSQDSTPSSGEDQNSQQPSSPQETQTTDTTTEPSQTSSTETATTETNTTETTTTPTTDTTTTTTTQTSTTETTTTETTTTTTSP